jgi:hypothetical protein
MKLQMTHLSKIKLLYNVFFPTVRGQIGVFPCFLSACQRGGSKVFFWASKMGSEKELKMGSVRPIQETRHKNQPTTKHKNHAVLYELSAVYIRVAHKSSWASDGGGGGGKWAVGSEPKDHYRTLALDIGEVYTCRLRS